MREDVPFLPFRSPRAHARRSDPSTSQAAARRVTAGHQTALQRHVWELLTTPATDGELIARWRERWPASQTTDSSIRTRRAELATARLVEQSGVVKLRSGRYAIVWRRARMLSPDVHALAGAPGPPAA